MSVPKISDSFIATVFLTLLVGTCVVSLVTKSLIALGVGVLFTVGISRALIGRVSE